MPWLRPSSGSRSAYAASAIAPAGSRPWMPPIRTRSTLVELSQAGIGSDSPRSVTCAAISTRRHPAASRASQRPWRSAIAGRPSPTPGTAWNSSASGGTPGLCAEDTPAPSRGGLVRAVRSAGLDWGIPAMSRPRVLLVSESCNPDWVSLPLAGEAGHPPGADHVRLDGGHPARRGPAPRAGPSQQRARLDDAHRRQGARVLPVRVPRLEALPEQLAAGRFDLVHRLTPMSPVMPSDLARRLKRIGVPFVVGPLNGGLPYPAGAGGAPLEGARPPLALPRRAPPPPPHPLYAARPHGPPPRGKPRPAGRAPGLPRQVLLPARGRRLPGARRRRGAGGAAHQGGDDRPFCSRRSTCCSARRRPSSGRARSRSTSWATGPSAATSRPSCARKGSDRA